MLPDKNLSFPSCVRVFSQSIQLAGSWGSKGARTARGAAGGVEGRGELSCHRAALGALSKEKNGVFAEEIEDKSRASLFLSWRD